MDRRIALSALLFAAANLIEEEDQKSLNHKLHGGSTLLNEPDPDPLGGGHLIDLFPQTGSQLTVLLETV